MSLRNSCRLSVVMSGFRSIALFGAAAAFSAGVDGHRVGGRFLGRVHVLDELDALLLDVAVEVLDVGLVEVDLRYRRGDVAEGEHAELLTPVDQPFDLLKLLKLCNQHLFCTRLSASKKRTDGAAREVERTAPRVRRGLKRLFA